MPFLFSFQFFKDGAPTNDRVRGRRVAAIVAARGVIAANRPVGRIVVISFLAPRIHIVKVQNIVVLVVFIRQVIPFVIAALAIIFAVGSG